MTAAALARRPHWPGLVFALALQVPIASAQPRSMPPALVGAVPATAGAPRVTPAAPFLLPVHTPELSPGRVTPRAQPIKLTRPLFLIGTDRFSLEWLATHRSQLLALRAVGMVVEAPDLRTLAQVARAGQGLTIAPASASTLARTLDLTHYPVLLSTEGFEQ